MKTVIAILLFFAALELQIAVAAHFSVLASMAFPFIVVLGLALLESPSESLSLWLAFFGGILWDLLGSSYFGWGSSMLLATVLFVKFAKLRYVRLPLS